MTEEKEPSAMGKCPDGAPIAVVGAVNMDICGMPYQPLVGADSNPGRVSLSMGGVGRNIAHNLALLGQPVSLITVFGDDVNGRRIQEHLEKLGINLSNARTVSGASTSCYVFITDEKGEMQLAISDMGIYTYMTPQFMENRLDVLNRSCLCVIDTNLPQETIEYLAEHLRVPIFADPVSTAKMHKLERILGHIHTLKPNRLEAEYLSGMEITDEASLKKAADVLLDKGIKNVYITLGAKGVLCAGRDRMLLIPGIQTNVRSATGGGDCFMAGLAYAYRAGLSSEEAARLALAAGAICAESDQTINEELSAQMMYERAGF
ncbi:MAG: carbohydrate kinase family protein [Lachnospiraceae bacterium]|nr:carbohydrate kinase family protein [Lachnospiraceae bacterium]